MGIVNGERRVGMPLQIEKQRRPFALRRLDSMGWREFRLCPSYTQEEYLRTARGAKTGKREYAPMMKNQLPAAGEKIAEFFGKIVESQNIASAPRESYSGSPVIVNAEVSPHGNYMIVIMGEGTGSDYRNCKAYKIDTMGIVRRIAPDPFLRINKNEKMTIEKIGDDAIAIRQMGILYL